MGAAIRSRRLALVAILDDFGSAAGLALILGAKPSPVYRAAPGGVSGLRVLALVEELSHARILPALPRIRTVSDHG